MDRASPGLLLLYVLACCQAPFAQAQEAAPSEHAVVLSSGVEGGGYWSAGMRLQSVAEKELNLTVENLPSNGSTENLEKLLDDDSLVNLAFAQSDAVQHYLNQHEGEISKLELLENIGQECVFIVTGIDSEFRTDADMEAADDFQIAIASQSSGVAVTFDYLMSQLPEMADSEVVYTDTVAIMEDLNASDAPVDAVMVVHRPREHSAEVDHALANADRFRFMELSDDRLTQELWNGRRVYRTMKLGMPGTATPVQTICVQGLLLANKRKLTVEQRNQLSDLVSYYWMQVYVTQ
jgi:TRAP-type uncharacterized transport system substrate-binding protein